MQTQPMAPGPPGTALWGTLVLRIKEAGLSGNNLWVNLPIPKCQKAGGTQQSRGHGCLRHRIVTGMVVSGKEHTTVTGMVVSG